MLSKVDNTFSDLHNYLTNHAINNPKYNLPLYTYDNSKKYLLNKKIFICAGCELSYVYDCLNFITEIYHTFVSKTSMDIFSELNNPNTIIKSFNADYFIISIVQLVKSIIGSYEKISSEGYKNSTQLLEIMIDEMFNNLIYSIKKVRTFNKNPIFLPTMIYISNEMRFGKNEYLNANNDISYYELLKKIELKLFHICKQNENVYLLNIDSIFEPYNKYECIKPYQNAQYGHLTYYGSALVVEDFYNQICTLEKSLNRIKCVVMDCDNTMWKGILIEDGPDKLVVNQEVCNILLSLVYRGIAIALCSKNNPHDKDTIFKIIDQTTYGRHISKYFVSCKINWSPKSENLKIIAKELNIGLDSLAFFDDSDFERREVKENAQEVMVFNEKDIFNVLNNPHFDSINGLITTNTKKRIDTYLKNKERNDELDNIKSKNNNIDEKQLFENFMINSKFNLDMFNATEDDLTRIFELIQRTNQMNATLNRTDLDVLKIYFKNDLYKVYGINLKDKYDDYGLIGTVIVKKGNHINILEFAFSCRAMGKKVEDYVIVHLLNNYDQQIQIKLEKTEKNKEFIKIFKEYDFEEKEDLLVNNNNKNNNYEIPKWFI